MFSLQIRNSFPIGFLFSLKTEMLCANAVIILAILVATGSKALLSIFLLWIRVQKSVLGPRFFSLLNTFSSREQFYHKMSKLEENKMKEKKPRKIS